MRVMVVDGGGRGQALGLKLASEGHEIFISPGNQDFAENTGISTLDINGQIKAANKYSIDFTLVGADRPLALGIVDEFQEEGKSIFGPTAEQARIESDREYAKSISRLLSIPTGPFSIFTDRDQAIGYAENRNWPLFVKDNELADGKGAKKCEDIDRLKAAISTLHKIVIEDYVDGPESSLHTFADGQIGYTIPILLRDHKQLGENMTDGMATIGPLPYYSASEATKLGEVFADPIIKNIGFKGLLFSGLKGPKGDERNLEYNARFGDTEAQSFMALMESNLLPILIACTEARLSEIAPPKCSIGKAVVCLMLATEGYPTNPKIGTRIEGLEEAAKVKDVTLLHAGTRMLKGQLVTDGGRAINVVSIADSPLEAIEQSYSAASKIAFDGKPPLINYDIGQDLIS